MRDTMKRFLIATLSVGLLTAQVEVLDPPQNTIVLRTPVGAVGGYLPDDANTVMHCAFDGADSKPDCGKRNIKHRGVGPMTSINYLKLDPTGTGADPLDFAGDFYVCTIFMLPSVSGAPAILTNGTGAGASSGYAVWSDTSGWVNARIGGATVFANPNAALRAGSVSAFCFGRSGTTGVVRFNDHVTRTAPVGLPMDTAQPFKFSGSASFYELVAVEATPSDALFTSLTSAAMNCTTPGRCFPTNLPNTVLHLDGDDYEGGNWNGNPNRTKTLVSPGGLSRPRYEVASNPATTFTLVGDVRWTDTRLNWPSLSWTMNGSVPKVTSSPSFPKGMGVEHTGLVTLGNSADYLTLGSGNDVLDQANYTGCVIYNQTSGSGRTLIQNASGTGNVPGFLITSGAASAGLSVYMNSVSLPATCPTADSSLRAICFGRGGTTGYFKCSNGATVTGTVGTGSGTSDVVQLARNLPGSIYEVYFTTTPASDALLTSLTNQALSCTAPGACFKPDANAVMHCDMDTDWIGGQLKCGINKGNDAWVTNGTLTASKSRLNWPQGTTKAVREGAGPFSLTSYLTSSSAGLLTIPAGGGATVEAVALLDRAATGAIFTRVGTRLDGFYTIGGGNKFWCRVGTSSSTCTPTIGGVNYLACSYSRTGTDAWTVIAKCNNEVNVNSYTGVTGVSLGDTETVKLGSDEYGGWAGVIHEVVVTGRALPESELATRARSFLTQTGSRGEPITVTNTAPAMCEVDGKLYNVPANTLCHKDGARSFRGSVTNYAKYSEQFDNAAWVDRSVTASTVPLALSGWSDVNYLQKGDGTTADVLDGDTFTVCAILRHRTAASNYHLMANGNTNVSGWSIGALNTNVAFFKSNHAGSGVRLDGSTITNGTLAVFCGGRQQTTLWLKINNNPTSSRTSAPYVGGTTYPLRIGRDSEITGRSLVSNTDVYEVYATTTAPSDALLTALTTQAMACTTVGKCFTPDANVVLHCDMDTDWSANTLNCSVGGAWTTSGTLNTTASPMTW